MAGDDDVAKVISTHVFATAPTGDSAPDSITRGAGSIWVEYGNGAPSTGGGNSKIVQYSLSGTIEHTYTAHGLADGLKFNPVTGDVWVLNNNDADANLQLIDPRTDQISGPLHYAPPYSDSQAFGRGFDDVVFKGNSVFLSETNPVNPGDPVVVKLANGDAPFGKLVTTPVLSLGDTGENVVTGRTDQRQGFFNHLFPGKSMKSNNYWGASKFRIYNLTAIRQQVLAPKVFLETLLHEWVHHYDFTGLQLERSPHTSGFFARIRDLAETLGVGFVTPPKREIGTLPAAEDVVSAPADRLRPGGKPPPQWIRDQVLALFGRHPD